jgi:hypothetical protein
MRLETGTGRVIGNWQDVTPVLAAAIQIVNPSPRSSRGCDEPGVEVIAYSRTPRQISMIAQGIM